MIVLSFDEYSKLLIDVKMLEAFTKIGYFRVIKNSAKSVRFTKYRPT